jgi:hypothetical protein
VPDWVVYEVPEEKTSPLWCKAFAKRSGLTVSRSTVLKDGDVALFGSPRLVPLLRQAQDQGRQWIYGDKAYFRRGIYFRCTLNRYMQTQIRYATPKRWEKLGIKIKPWRSGRKILLCPQSDEHFRQFDLTQIEWIKTVTQQLRKHTDRPIQVWHKVPGNPEIHFELALKDVHAVVVFSSVAGVQAMMHGVPCIATHLCAASPLAGSSLDQIEDLPRPDNREQLAWWLADNQWTLEEMERGMAWDGVMS